MEINFHGETALQLLFSFIIGTAIGIEREYRSKAAGLRTMIMICLGSTIFTELSMVIGDHSEDRIASNIITGIGFLGAGVIFKDGLSISGITTATTIWITAALGMAVGAGQYFIAFVGCIAILIVLLLFDVVQQLIARFHHERMYKITTRDEPFAAELEAEARRLKLKLRKERDFRSNGDYSLAYQVIGREKRLDELTKYLKASEKVISYEY